MPVMRIAVAGTGGLGCLIAHYITEDTSHQVVLLSRTPQSALSARGFQVTEIDYSDDDSLQFALRGVDTVISTVTGSNQIQLIKAAVAARVRRFAPAEFEGRPHLRPVNDPLDRGRSDARRWLDYYSSSIESTSFVCGIFYERFQPGGLARARVGARSGIGNEGDYIMDVANMSAQAPAYDKDNQPNVTICMTSVADVARLVTRAIEMPRWPAELRMSGERVTVQQLLMLVRHLKKQDFSPLTMHNPSTLLGELAVAAASGDRARGIRLHTLISTVEGRYDFAQSNLNSTFPDVQPERFAQWFVRKWDLQ